jgi:choline monooxygenase
MTDPVRTTPTRSPLSAHPARLSHLAARSLSDVLADFDASLPLAEASTIPGSWYTDPRVFDLEKSAVFGRTWQVVGRTSQVERAGQYVTAQIGDEPIVVVRGSDGVLRAFFNVCRHHAAAVMTEREGCAERLRCPYHGWTYSLEGELKTPHELGEIQRFDPAQNGLVPVRVATWESFVFVCLSPDAPPLLEDLGALPAQVAPLHLGGLQFAERREYELSCNWKVFVDNYLDGGYHVPYLHRGLNSILSFRDYTIECFERFCLQSSPIDPAGGEAMTASVRSGQALYYWLYPNFMLNWYEGYLDTNFVVPLGLDRMKVVFDFYFADVSPAAQERNARSMDVSQRIQDEDHAICESVQRGLGSRAYGAGRLSVRREAGENLFHRLLAADLRRGPAV